MPRALAIAAMLLLLVNLVIGQRLQVLARSDSLDECALLARQVARFQSKPDVRVLAFGNSHALASFRPPALAVALGEPDRDFFNLSLPGSSPHEMRLVAQRYLASFPNAKLALCAVDPMYFRTDIPLRMRYWTAHDPAERWAYASEAPSLEERVCTFASMAFPFADYLEPLKLELASHPRAMWHNLVSAHPAPSDYYRNMAVIPYPWGFPPVWNDPAIVDLALQKRIRDRPSAVRDRMANVAPGTLDLAHQIDELAELTSYLEAHGLRVVFVETPYRAPLAEAMGRSPQYRAYRKAIAAYMGQSHHQLLVPALQWHSNDFYVLDHLNDLGARRMADWLAQALPDEFKSAFAQTKP